MTASDNNTIPDFFDDNSLDPVSVATGRPVAQKKEPKRKAGFYFSEAMLKRFNRTFHQLKLDGVPVENKSALAETALHFALDDLERGVSSRLMERLKQR